MTDDTSSEVLLEAEATPEEVAGVEAVLREVGIDWPVLAALERRGIGDYPWVIMLAGPPGVIFGVFVKKFAELAAEDAYAGLKKWVQKLASSRRDSNGTITINDPASGTVIVLDPEIPDEAYRQLPAVDPERDGGEAGYLSWNNDEKRWAPPWWHWPSGVPVGQRTQTSARTERRSTEEWADRGGVSHSLIIRRSICRRPGGSASVG